MKQLLLSVGCVAIITVLALAYCLSPYSWSTSHIRVSLIEGNGGHQAILQNAGILPVKVVGCEFISDTNERNPVVVGDVMQRELPNEVWENELVRNRCEGGKYRTRLLWPHQRIYSSPFFANVGIAYAPGSRAFQHQDLVRFLLFPHGNNRELDTLSSERFRVDDVGKLP
jgi:hypothetical protein